MKRLILPASLGLLHGINDAVAGCLLAMYAGSTMSASAVVFAFLGYSVLAFGGQLPVGWWMDRVQRADRSLFAAIILLGMAVVLSIWNVPAAILFSGIASSFVHVSGGALCFLDDPRQVKGAGLFTAPGVLGLVLGGMAGHTGWGIYLPVLLPLLVLLFFYFSRTALPAYTLLKGEGKGPLLEAHDYIMLVLLLAIALRSLLWNIFYMLAERQFHALLLIGISAFAGKLSGAYLADRIGWKPFTFLALSAAAVLLTFGRGHLLSFCAGIFFLQGVVPVTLWVMQQYLYGRPAAAAGLCLGAAILLAGLPSYLEWFRAISWDNNLLGTSLVVLLLVNGLWLSATKRRV